MRLFEGHIYMASSVLVEEAVQEIQSAGVGVARDYREKGMTGLKGRERERNGQGNARGKLEDIQGFRVEWEGCPGAGRRKDICSCARKSGWMTTSASDYFMFLCLYRTVLCAASIC